MKRYNIALLLVLAILSSCTKDKSDSRPTLPDVSNKSNSSIRLFNFYNSQLDVTVNNLPLTAYPKPGTPNGQSTQLGLSFFPTGAWESPDNGAPFTIPNSLLDKNGNIHLQLRSRYLLSYGLPQYFVLDTVINNDVLHPRDYYIQGGGTMHVLDRDNVAPANGQQFKLRIINLGLGKDVNGVGGPVTLTYADGTPVAPELSGVAQNEASPYVLLDYGSFIFRLYDSKGGAIDITKQYVEPPSFPIYDPCAITPPSQQGIYAQLRTFKPGGVYSIVVVPGIFSVLDCNRYPDVKLFNAYHVITEQDPGVNYTYARVQAVNAVPGKSLTVKLDGQPVSGNTLDYLGNAAPDKSIQPAYNIVVQGTHTVEVWDGGTRLASKSLPLSPYDNYCIWVYPAADNKVDILFEANDMTGTVYTSTHNFNSAPDDGTNGAKDVIRFPYNLRMRFLNLATDQPYITFQNDLQHFNPVNYYSDTLRFPGAFINLPMGGQPARNPGITYVMGPYGTYNGANNQLPPEYPSVPRLIRAFASVPGPLPQVPGRLLANVPALNTARALIANWSLYDAGTQPTPESGVYTVALIGNATAGNGRMVFIKHNN